MAVFNEILTGGLNQIIARRLGIQTGGGAVVPAMAPEIFATLPLEVDRPEWKWLADERIAWGASQVAAVAGQRSKIRFAVPLGTNLLAVIDRVYVTTTAANWSIRRAQNPPVAVPGTTTLADTRFPNPNAAGNTGLNCSGTTEVGVTPLSWSLYVSTVAPSEREIKGPWIITPGHALEIATSSDNVTLNASAVWVERAALNSEL